jgi:hypothetical protein
MRCVIATGIRGEDGSVELPPAEILVGKYGVASQRTCTSDTGSTGSMGLRQRGHTSSTHCDPRERTGGVRMDVNIARGTTVPLVIRECQTGKTVNGRDIPHVLHRCR